MSFLLLIGSFEFDSDYEYDIVFGLSFELLTPTRYYCSLYIHKNVHIIAVL